MRKMPKYQMIQNAQQRAAARKPKENFFWKLINSAFFLWLATAAMHCDAAMLGERVAVDAVSSITDASPLAQAGSFSVRLKQPNGFASIFWMDCAIGFRAFQMHAK
jgi:hypothetical protein